MRMGSNFNIKRAVFTIKKKYKETQNKSVEICQKGIVSMITNN